MDFKRRAKELHNESIVIDAHLDLAGEINNRYEAGEREIIKKYYLEGFKKSGLNIIVSSLFIDSMFLPELALRNALDQISVLYDDIKSCNGEVELIKTKEDLDRVIKEKKIGIILSFEGVEPLINDIRLLNIFYELGVRGVGLVWSRRNYAADGCFFGPVEEGTKGGLTTFGVQLVKEAEKRGMFLDVSHLNDEGFWDLVEKTDKPFIASHSNTRALNNIMRNLEDKQIKTIADRNGVIGCNAIKSIIGPSREEASISYLCDHIDHIVKLVGAKHIGYGFDLCNSYYESELKYKYEEPSSDVFNGHSESLLITEELLRRGYSDEDIKSILGENFLRVFREILK